MHDDQVTFIGVFFIVLIISAMVYRLNTRTIIIAMLVSVAGVILLPGKAKKCKCSSQSSQPPCYKQEKEQEKEQEQEQEQVYISKTALDNKKEFIKNLKAVNDVYYEGGCPGDDALTKRMLEQGNRSKQSIDIRAKFDKYSLLHYFDEELDSHANSVWWDNDSLEHKF
jgi:hypothetical protein